MGGAVETTGTSSTISVPPNFQSHGVTYIVKYEDDNGNTGETSIRQTSGATQLTITTVHVEGLETQAGFGGFVAYDTLSSDISVVFKYTYSGNDNDVQPSWFKFSLQDKHGNQMAVLSNPTLNKGSHSGTVTISQSLFASLPTGGKGDSTHTIAQNTTGSSYYHDDEDENLTPLPTNYYSDPDDKLALYCIVADTYNRQYNTLIGYNQTTPVQTRRISNVFLKTTSTPEILSISTGVIYNSSDYWYQCINYTWPFCTWYNPYDGTQGFSEIYKFAFEYNAAGVIPTTHKTKFEICKALDNSVLLEVEVQTIYDRIEPYLNWYGSTCHSAYIYRGQNSLGINYSDMGITGSYVSNDDIDIYVRWKDNPSIRSNNMTVHKQSTSSCGS